MKILGWLNKTFNGFKRSMLDVISNIVDLPIKVKISILIGIVCGIIVSSFVAYDVLAEFGCSIVGIGGLLRIGIPALCIFIGSAFCIGFLCWALVSAPGFIKEKCKEISSGEFEITDIANSEAIKAVLLGIGLMAVIACTTLGVGISVGYLWWMIFC